MLRTLRRKAEMHRLAWVLALGATVLTGLAPNASLAQSRTYTLDADFDQGTLSGVNHNAPNNNQLQLSTTVTTFPVMWIANGGEDTVSRIDTSKPSTLVPSGGCETARYRTFFNSGTHNTFSGPAPSRTAVDSQGNVYVANRHFDGRPAQVMKILAEGGIDRNGNGVIDTSTDANNDCQIQASEIIPLVDANSNGVLDSNELADERVVWAVTVGTPGAVGRSLCIAPDGHIWVGLFNTGQYFKLSSVDGSVLAGPISTPGLTPYGCLVDGDGMLWSAGLGTNLGQLDTNVPAFVANRSHAQFGSNYGIAIGNNRVYLASTSGFSYIEYNPVSDTFSIPADVFQATLGISVDGNDDIVLGQTTIRKFDPPGGAVLWASANPFGSGSTRGIIPDANNDIWAVNLDNNNVTKFRGTDGAFLGRLPVGVQPYTYSDATGISLRNVSPFGTWTVVHMSGQPGTTWSNIRWNTEPQGSEPAGTSITTEARVAATQGGLALQPFTPAPNGGALNLMGQFIEVRATLRPNAAEVSPVLSDLTINAAAVGCDIDGDGDTDRNDVDLVRAAIGQTVAPGDPRDRNNDGRITVADARACALRCDLPQCAPPVNGQ